jgi:glutathione S-transferase
MVVRHMLVAAALAVCTTLCSAAGTTPQHNAAIAAPELTIYHIEGRRSQRVVWLCEEIGLLYKLSFRRGDVLGSMQDIEKVSPLMHMAPVIRYGGVQMVESGAILEYLLSQRGHGKLVPVADSPDYPLLPDVAALCGRRRDAQTAGGYATPGGH